jgi:hypothetical protein
LIRLRGWVCLVESDEAEEELGKKRDSKGMGEGLLVRTNWDKPEASPLLAVTTLQNH